METNDNKFDITISNLRQQKPEIKDAETLTDSIMERLTQKSKRLTPSFLLIVRTVSSSAAVYLLGLFLFQQMDFTEPNKSTQTVQLVEPKLEVHTECMQNANTEKPNMLDIYFCYMKSNSIKNQRLQSYYQQLKN